jgi:hypothetical protein
MKRATSSDNRSGQAILFLIMVLMVALFAVLWNFDLHKTVILKMRMRDAGDSAALTAARWQAIALNTVGELNLVQAALLTDYLAGGVPVESIEAELIKLHNLRRRVALHGPLVAFAAAQQAAFHNGAHANAGYAREYSRLTIDYGSGSGDAAEMAEEYLALLDTIIENGIATKASFYRAGHILLDPGFYDAIESGKFINYWCPFYFEDYYMWWLENYTSYGDWPPLPEGGAIRILDLDIYSTSNSLYHIADFDEDPVKRNELQGVVDETSVDPVEVSLIEDDIINWHMYGIGWMDSWQEFIDEWELPFRDLIAPEYDYMGAESILELAAGYTTTMPGGSTNHSIRWVAAAKPYGYLENSGNEQEPWRPNYFGIVLPAFNNVRLIPVQHDVGDIRGSEAWWYHVYHHLPDYLSRGPNALDANSNGLVDYDCRYCQDLLYWEDSTFRADGLEWLSNPDNTRKCLRGGGGGGGGGSGGPPHRH